ncbi:MAG: tRNA (adenosine(37)-N6)-threonylcarbamoyltransferase complex ATPase subunit type 1 TsaE [bacterium]|nr:tRNA (adenosine(37)-N6)-threonylcarbamoyltransferase complex ATPase subunit type 1 TsaE [bacterium]
MSKPPPFPLLWEYRSASPAQTIRVGRAIGRACRGGEIILLDGPLGAGKTCLANGIARGLNIEGPLISPTYVILRTYASPRGLKLHHLDFYRLSGDDDLASVGLEDCFGEDAVILAEWPGQCPGAFEEFTLALRLEPLDETVRRIRAYAGTVPSASPLTSLKGLGL